MASRYVPTGVPFLRSQNIKAGRLDLSSLKYIDQQFHAQLAKSKLEAGDLVIVRTGEPGAAAVIPEGLGPLNCADLVIAKTRSDVSAEFLSYAINETAQQFVRAHTVGAVQQHFNVASAKKLVLHVPPIAEQQAIVAVLGALDDKIALNERIADTALELADCLYVRERTAHDCWPEVTLGATSKWLSGGTPRTSEPSYWKGDIPWISAASLKTPWLYESERSVTDVGAQNGTRLVPKGSIIFVVRGMSLTSEFRVGVTQREVAFGQDCKALIPHLGIDSATLFLAMRAQSAKILGMVDLAGHGTGRLVTERVANLRVRLPQGEAAAEFAERSGALLDRAIAATSENRTLADLRDTLLPQLLSGKLRVKDAARTVEEVA